MAGQRGTQRFSEQPTIPPGVKVVASPHHESTKAMRNSLGRLQLDGCDLAGLIAVSFQVDGRTVDVKSLQRSEVVRHVAQFHVFVAADDVRGLGEIDSGQVVFG